MFCFSMSLLCNAFDNRRAFNVTITAGDVDAAQPHSHDAGEVDALGRKYRHNDALINNIGLVLLDETVSITPIAECSLSKY